MNEPLPERMAMLRLQADVARSNAALGRSDHLPRLRFDLRGRCAGLALPESWSIRLNTALLREHEQAFVDETVPHEWAHLLAFAVHGRNIRPHGAEWKTIMRTLGCEPDVCHNYAVQPARKIQRFAYHCRCQSHQLSSIRHRRALSGQRYVCKKCGDVLCLGDAIGTA